MTWVGFPILNVEKLHLQATKIKFCFPGEGPRPPSAQYYLSTVFCVLVGGSNVAVRLGSSS